MHMKRFVEWLRLRGYPYCRASLSLVYYGPEECYVNVGFGELQVSPADLEWLTKDRDFQELPPSL